MVRAAREPLQEPIEEHRDERWRRTEELRIERADEVERWVDEVGFAWTLADVRTPGPSLYVAVCGRRDAHMPRNVQKDPEASAAWVLKDEVMRRGRVYYGKLLKKRATLVSRRLLPAFNALFGIPRREERARLSPDARAVLKVLRAEWEMGTADLRDESKIEDRARFTRAVDELQACLKVVPGEVLYVPRFTYIWYLAEGRFAEELSKKVARPRALAEIAAAYLAGAGETRRGELASVTGLSRVDAGKGNHALVADGRATRLDTGVYRLASLEGAHEDEPGS